MENLNIIAYCIYLIICVSITAIVGSNLHKNGYHLILDLFENEKFSKTLNNLLLVGYYLINIGYIAITVNAFGLIVTVEHLIVEVISRVGAILIILGILHINNILTLQFLSKRKQKIIQLFNN